MSVYSDDVPKLTKVSTEIWVNEVNKIKLEDLQRSDVYFREWGTPIPRDKNIALFIKDQVLAAFASPDPLLYDPPPTDSSSVNGELKRFIVSLKGYYDSPNPVIPFSYLVNGITDFDFASTLKKARTKSLVTSMHTNGFFLDAEDWIDVPRFVNVQDIGDMFNHAYWFFWEEPDPHDEVFCRLPTPVVDPDVLEEITEHCIQLLPDDPPRVLKEEVLFGLNSSTCLSNNSSKKKWKASLEDPNSLDFENKKIYGYRAYVLKRPQDSRAALVTPLPVSNTIRYLEKQLAVIAAMMTKHGSIYVKNSDLFEVIRKKFKSTWSMFLCRDIEKDGLTKPRYLLKAIAKALKSKYRRVFDTSLLDIFDSFSWETSPGVWESPPRGVGLGMSAAITTILQITLFEFTLSRVRYYVGKPNLKAGCLAYHDDFVAGFENREDYDDFDYYEDKLFEELGLRRKRKKSWAADNLFVICERYSRDEVNRKTSYQLRLAYLPFAACNIAHAKVLFSQFVRYKIDIDLSGLLKKLVSYWGYEFYPTEYHYPIEFGGWFPFLFRSVNMCLQYFPSDFNRDFSKAYAGSRKSTMIPAPDKNKDSKTYPKPVERLSKRPLDALPEDLKKEYFIGENNAFIASKMKRYNFAGAQLNGWMRLLHTRLVDWDQSINWNYNTVAVDLRTRFPFTDFVPKEPNILNRVGWDSSMIKDGDHPLVMTMNPQSSLINSYIPGAFPKRIPCPVDPAFNPKVGYPLSALNNIRYLQQDFEEPLKDFGLSRVLEYGFFSSHIDITGTGWNDPTSVCLYYWDKKGDLTVPINPSPKGKDIRDFEQTRWYLILSHPSTVQIQNIIAAYPKYANEIFPYLDSHEEMTEIANEFLKGAMKLQYEKEMKRVAAQEKLDSDYESDDPIIHAPIDFKEKTLEQLKSRLLPEQSDQENSDTSSPKATEWWLQDKEYLGLFKNDNTTFEEGEPEPQNEQELLDDNEEYEPYSGSDEPISDQEEEYESDDLLKLAQANRSDSGSHSEDSQSSEDDVPTSPAGSEDHG